jgi:hypothetical protein
MNNSTKFIAMLIAISISLSACIFAGSGISPERQCGVRSEDQFSPRLHGRPYSKNQLSWLSGKDSILLMNNSGRLFTISTSEESAEGLLDTGIKGLWFALARERNLIAVVEGVGDGLVATNIYDVESLELIETIPDMGQGSFSPDGRLLAGTITDEKAGWVRIVDLDDLSVVQDDILPTRDRWNYYLESWSNRDEWISVRGPMETGVKISVVDWPSEESIQLHEFVGCHDESAWSPTTHEIAYLGNPDHNWDIFIELPGAGNARNLTSTSEVDEYQPSWSPDGKYIVYVGVVSRSEGTTFWQDLFIVNAETGEAIQLTETPDAFESLPSWSPDGEKIAYLSESDGEVYLYTIDVDGANRTEIVRIPE